jgi:hypothetical protein
MHGINKMMRLSILLFVIFLVSSCVNTTKPAVATTNTVTLSRAEYRDSLYGFWLGQCIANWTGLVTEMDKIGNIGEIKTGKFYTRNDWGKPDQPSIWGQGVPSDLSETIDFVTVKPDGIWGSDDDTDIEYIYQYLLKNSESVLLTPEQIRAGWMKHVYSSAEPTPFGHDPEGDYENFLWVSNQKAFDLMQAGTLPPLTGSQSLNEHYDMIDAQLTTEIFGFFAPVRVDIALKISDLPVRTVADKEAADIARFYITMYSLASAVDKSLPMNEQVIWMAEQARKQLPDDQYPAAMYDFVKKLYLANTPWEKTRDAISQRYQVQQLDGYTITARNLYCNGCFAAGINFAASLVSLFYGEGDLKETIKIGALTGWDSDNPTATWGGLLGFMYGKKAIEQAFGQTFSNRFNIHRTRRNFPNNGIDTFENMAEDGVAIVDKVVIQLMGGRIDAEQNSWMIPVTKN